MAVGIDSGGNLYSYAPGVPGEVALRRFGVDNGTSNNSSGSSNRRRSSSGGSSSEAEARRLAEQARIAQQAMLERVRQEQIRIEQARQEQIRINILRSKLISQGIQRRTNLLRDANTKQRIREEVLMNSKTNEGIITRTNLETGNKTIRTFSGSRGNKGNTLTGGISENGLSKKANQEVIKGLKEVGVTPILNKDGVVKGFKSNITLKSYPYTEQGMKNFERDIKTPEAIIRQRVKLSKETGMSVAQKFDTSKLSGKLNQLVTNYEGNIESTKQRLSSSFQNNDIGRLGELQRKRNLTNAERKEMNKLKKKTSQNYKLAGEFIGKTIFNSLVNLGIGSVALATSLYNNPIGTTKNLPSSVIKSLKNDLSRIKQSPQDALQVALEYYVLGGALKGVGKVGKVSLRQASKILPGYVKSVNGKWVLRKTPAEVFKVKGQERFLKNRVLKPSIKRPFSSTVDFLKGRKAGQFKKFTKDPGLMLKEQTVKSGSTPLSKQVLLEGKTITAVNASADQLTSWLKRKQLIRKPIPGQKAWDDYNFFPKKIGNSIKKFDNGIKLTTKEFAEVNLWLQKNVAPNITLLERSLYLDPAKGLRVSRLGISAEKNATLKDILKGNFRLSFKGNKPQVLIFENAKVAKFPKSLADVKLKLLNDKPLTIKEIYRLIRWQIKTGSGKFKPIGSTIYAGGKELEVTLAPGEFIKRIKRVGFGYVEGKKVSFVTAEIFKPSKSLLSQIKKANLGKLTKVQVSNLEKTLSKKLGRKMRIETPTLKSNIRKITARRDASTPVIRVRGNSLINTNLARSIRRVNGRFNKRISLIKRNPIKRKPIKRNPIKRTIIKRKPIKRTTRTTVRKPTVRKPIIRRALSPKPNKPPVKIQIPEGFKSKQIRNKQQVYYVKIKRRGKIVNLTPRPLVLKDAKDFLAYSVDNGLERSAWFEPLGNAKKVVVLPKKMQNYFNKNQNKLRPFKIRLGNKNEIKRGYIEKSKYLLDTKREKLQMKGIRKSPVIKSKSSAGIKKQRLNNLAKARARLKQIRKNKK